MHTCMYFFLRTKLKKRWHRPWTTNDKKQLIKLSKDPDYELNTAGNSRKIDYQKIAETIDRPVVRVKNTL